MSVLLEHSQNALSEAVQRWLPPDVGEPANDPEPRVEELLPTLEEERAIREQARAAAREQGFQEGYEHGHREGRERAEREANEARQQRAEREQAEREQSEQTLRETVAALEGVARALADPLAASADALEPELLALVTALARRVVLSELEQDPARILQVLQQSLAKLPSRQHVVRVRVNPADQAVLSTYAEEQDERIVWLEDAALERGGCLIESGPSRIDATLDTRMRQTVEAIWGDVHRDGELAAPDMRLNGASERNAAVPEAHAPPSESPSAIAVDAGADNPDRPKQMPTTETQTQTQAQTAMQMETHDD